MSLYALYTFGLSPAFVIAVFASASFLPTTLGTVTAPTPLPSDTAIATSLPGFTSVPAFGSCAPTLPLATSDGVQLLRPWG